MNPVWLGPYIISRHIGKGLHELKSMEGKVLKAKANINRLKIYKRCARRGPSTHHEGVRRIHPDLRHQPH